MSIKNARKLLQAAKLVLADGGGGSEEFIELVKSKLQLDGRQIKFTNKSTLGGVRFDDVYVNFINLPEGVGTAGGGAEAENNRSSFWIRGFGKEDPHAPPPNGKVQVELSNTTLPREFFKPFRKKTGTPEAIAKYLADFINKIVKEVEPKYTHTKKT